MNQRSPIVWRRVCHSGAWLVALAVSCVSLVELPAETVLLRNATIHPASGDTIDRGSILIRGDKIAAMGSSVNASADRVVDLDGLHLYPGLLAAGTSLGLLEVNAVRATRDYSEVGRFTPEIASWWSVNPDSELIPVARANGIAYFLPVPRGGIVTGTSGWMATAGWTIEDMLVDQPAALHVFWPNMGLDTRPKSSFNNPSSWTSPKDQDAERQERVREIERFFADAQAYREARKANAPSVPSWEAARPFVERQRPIVVHADEERAIRAALDWAQRTKRELVIAGGRDAWRLARELAEAEVPVIYENVFTQPAPATDPYDVHFSAPAVLARAGVNLIIGAGLDSFATSNLRNLPYHAAQAIAFGLDRETALKAITLHPAKVLGIGDRAGSLEVGKDATLIAVSGDLFDIRENVQRMWIRGQEVDLESRHTRLYQKYRNRPRN